MLYLYVCALETRIQPIENCICGWVSVKQFFEHSLKMDFGT